MQGLLTILGEPESEVLEVMDLVGHLMIELSHAYLSEFKNSRPNVIFLSNDKGARNYVMLDYLLQICNLFQKQSR